MKVGYQQHPSVEIIYVFNMIMWNKNALSAKFFTYDVLSRRIGGGMFF